jgi:CDP-glucose 4,6-dehydratase
VLDALRSAPSIRVAVMVTTDKVYKGKPAPRAHDEEDALGGRDPYSASKAASELLISSYRDSYLAERGVRVASARAGNVVGGGDWAADRLIPDALRAWTAGDVLHVRSPGAVRPWQHVLEPLAAYLRLAQACWERPPPATSYNFGPGSARAVTVRQVVEIAREKFGGGLIRFGEGVDGPIESDWLALQVSRAERDLGVHGRWSIEESVGRAIDWYRGCGNGVTARALCDADIDAFEAVR